MKLFKLNIINIIIYKFVMIIIFKLLINIFKFKFTTSFDFLVLFLYIIFLFNLFLFILLIFILFFFYKFY